MTRSSTNANYFKAIPPSHPDELSSLQQGGLVLLPTANLWQLVVQADNYAAVGRMLQLCPATDTNRPELIFTDRPALLAWFPRLHPKLDTLLSYHGRALTILTPANDRVADALVDKAGEVAVRVAIDADCHALCKHLGSPLAGILAVGLGQQDLPTRFGKIRSDVLQAATFTVTRRQREDLDTQPALRIRLNNEEVEFV